MSSILPNPSPGVVPGTVPVELDPDRPETYAEHVGRRAVHVAADGRVIVGRIERWDGERALIRFAGGGWVYSAPSNYLAPAEAGPEPAAGSPAAGEPSGEQEARRERFREAIARRRDGRLGEAIWNVLDVVTVGRDAVEVAQWVMAARDVEREHERHGR